MSEAHMAVKAAASSPGGDEKTTSNAIETAPTFTAVNSNTQITAYEDASVDSPRRKSASEGANEVPERQGAKPAAVGQVCSNCGTSKTPLWRRSPNGSNICNACGLYLKARNTSRPTTLKKGQAAGSPSHKGPRTPVTPEKARPELKTECAEAGSCPGGGRCNGTGGAEGCNGCPAFNNRLAKKAQAPDEASDEPAMHQSAKGTPETPQSASGELSCKNCNTTVTPLWRRDGEGHTICNACGLYFKLRGYARPTTMKKATIKRRKRVVPAGLEHGDGQPDSAETSPSERGFPQDISGSRPLGPPPVDFTGYHAPGSGGRYDPYDRQTYHPPLVIPPVQPRPETHEHSRKRSFSIAEGTRQEGLDRAAANRPGSISSILNPADSANPDNLPTSVPQPPQDHTVSLPPLHPPESRKERLLREANELKEALRAKEREIEMEEQAGVV